MADMNVVTIQGRLVRDSELEHFGQKNTAKLKFSLANNIGFGEYKHVSYFNCEMFGKSAEAMAKWLVKGKAIIVTGELKQERWETTEGLKRSMDKIQVRSLSFAEARANSEQPENNQKDDNPFAKALNNDLPDPKTFDDDDIPF